MDEMKTILLAAAAAVCLGVGAAQADQGEDSGAIDPNSYFTELPGEVSTAPGARPNDAPANAWQLLGQQSTSTTQATPAGGPTGATLN
jgi:hypothetical protein